MEDTPTIYKVEKVATLKDTIDSLALKAKEIIEKDPSIDEVRFKTITSSYHELKEFAFETKRELHFNKYDNGHRASICVMQDGAVIHVKTKLINVTETVYELE